MTDRDRLATSFGRQANSYEKGRPEYPVEAVEWLLEHVPRAGPVLDLGAGTGKLTRVVQALGYEVVATDPDRAMLDRLERQVHGVSVALGTAEDLPFEGASFSAVVGGQMWHWVDPEAASLEAGRVLRPEGWIGLVWNVRDVREPWVAALAGVVGTSAAERLVEDDAVVIGEPFGPVERLVVEWSRPMTPETLLDMVRSRSHVILADNATRGRIEGEVMDLVAARVDRAEGGEFVLPYVTHAFRARRP